MADEKPLPLMVDGKPHYTLTSYDPVEIEVLVPAVTGDDLEFAIDAILEAEGASRERLSDAAWVKEHFNASSPDEFYEMVTDYVKRTNNNLVEEEKLGTCLTALADRLCQRPLPEMLEECRAGLALTYQQRFAQAGVTREQFIEQAGQTEESFEEMVSMQAEITACQQAALSAMASERKVQVSEEEIPRYLGVDESQASEFLSRVRAENQLDRIHDAAVRSKAASIVLAESSCTYHHETTEEAKERMATILEIRDRFEEMSKEEGSSESDGEDEGLHLV